MRVTAFAVLTAFALLGNAQEKTWLIGEVAPLTGPAANCWRPFSFASRESMLIAGKLRMLTVPRDPMSIDRWPKRF